MRLPADNLHEFINGHKHFYTVDTDYYTIGDTVTLYDDHEESSFKIYTIAGVDGMTVLGLGKPKGWNE